MARYVVGDIHGNHKALVQVLKEVKFDKRNDLLIVIGDVVDGYDDSYSVVIELLKLRNVALIIGNHDYWFIDHMNTGWKNDVWLKQGGKNTLKSYSMRGYSYPGFPKEHIKFFERGVYHYQLDGMLFVHGGFKYPKLPEDESQDVLMWDRSLYERCRVGLKIKEWTKVFLGHTTTENEGSIPIVIQPSMPEAAKVIQLDCGAGCNGRLCLYNIDNDDYVLSDYAPELNKREFDV